MTAIATLRDAAACGLKIRLDGADLVVSPPDRLTRSLRAAIQEHRPLIVEILEDAAGPADYRRPEPSAECSRCQADRAAGERVLACSRCDVEIGG